MKSDAPEVSVVIPARNAEHTLPLQLAALAEQVDAPVFEVVIVDNGSVDRTSSVAAEWSDRLWISVVDGAQRAGAGYARNVGAQCAAAEKLLFCDADDVVSPRWVGLMSAALDRGSVLVSGPIVRVTPEHPIGWVPCDPSYGTEVPSYMGFLPCVLAGSMGIWRADYIKVGGYDNSYRGGCEDVDFSWRAQLAGMQVVTAPGCYLYYTARAQAGEVFAQERRYTSQGILLWVRFQDRPGIRGPSLRWTISAVLRGLFALRPRMMSDADLRYDWARRLGADLGSLEGHLRYRVLKRLPGRELIGT